MANQNEMRDRMSSVEDQLKQLAASIQLITAQLQSLQVNPNPPPTLPEIVVPRNKAQMSDDEMPGLEDDMVLVGKAKLDSVPKIDQDKRVAKLEEKVRQL